MEQVKHDTVLRYTSPRTRVVFVKAQGVLCGSPYGENTEKFTLGENTYGDEDFE